jgi:hypothetical protein
MVRSIQILRIVIAVPHTSKIAYSIRRRFQASSSIHLHRNRGISWPLWRKILPRKGAISTGEGGTKSVRMVFITSVAAINISGEGSNSVIATASNLFICVLPPLGKLAAITCGIAYFRMTHRLFR